MDADPNPGPCPGENTLLDYAGGLLGSASVLEIDRHVDACSSCQVVLGRWLRAESPAHRESPDGADIDLAGAATRAPELERGASLHRYVLLKPLGTGGMGLVFAAYDPLLDRTVAIKVLRHEVATAMSSSARIRMLREARAMASLSHPNVVAVHDAGLFHGRVYLAMEYLEGGSLADWLKASPRRWKEIRDVFVQAGRGLAAAHERGLVHRDFKPQNVLFSGNGRVKISDFGLVRPTGGAAGSPQPAPLPALEGLDPQLAALHGPPGERTVTATGTLMGTPGYIAPEQRRGLAPDSRADQYSFCASLHLALYGRLPAVAAAMAAPPRAPSRVPDWLDRLVARGLSDDPTDRYPAMEALLDELSTRDHRIRRRAGAVAAVSLALAAATTAGVVATRQPARCRDRAARLELAWGQAPRAAISAAFARSTLAVAAQSWVHLGRALDRYAEDWTHEYERACAEERRDPPAFALRASCLDARLEDLGHTVRVLSSPSDLMVREDAARAVSDLLPPEACAAAGRAAPEPPPPAAEIQERIRAIHQKLGEAWALYRAGEHARAMPIAEALVADARSVESPGVLAQSLALAAQLHSRLLHPKEAIERLKVAVHAAESAGNQALAAQLLADLAQELTPRGQHEAAADALDHGDALLQHLGDSAATEASLLLARAELLGASGRWREAIPLLERSVSLSEQAFGPTHPRTAAALLKLARQMKDARDALRAQERASRGSEIYERIYGPNHPDRLGALQVLGQLARDRGDHALEERIARQILDARLMLYGPDSMQVARARWNLATALDMAAPGQALDEFRKTLATFERTMGPSGADPQLSALHFNIGGCLYELGEDEAARVEFQQASDILDRVRGPGDPKKVHPLTGLGMANAALGRLAEAETLFQRAIAVARSAGDDNADLQFPHLIAGQAYYEARQFARARKSYEQARRFVLIHSTEGSVDFALLEAKLAAAELADGQVEAALKRAGEARQSFERALGADHPFMAQVLTVMGEAHRRSGKVELALPLLQSAAQLRRAHRRRPIETAVTYLALADALKQSGAPADRIQPWLDAARAELARNRAWGEAWLRAAQMRH